MSQVITIKNEYITCRSKKEKEVFADAEDMNDLPSDIPVVGTAKTFTLEVNQVIEETFVDQWYLEGYSAKYGRQMIYPHSPGRAMKIYLWSILTKMKAGTEVRVENDRITHINGVPILIATEIEERQSYKALISERKQFNWSVRPTTWVRGQMHYYLEHEDEIEVYIGPHNQWLFDFARANKWAIRYDGGVGIERKYLAMLGEYPTWAENAI